MSETDEAAVPKGPIVSVGMPVFNGEATLAEAIESFLAQTLSDIELIISDNASTDGTAAICQEYAARDQRIRYIRKPRNIGGAANYNSIVPMARGKYFNWAPCDDVVLPRFLESCVDALEANPRAVIAYTRAAMIDAEGHRLHEYEDATEGGPWSPRVSERYRRFMREVTRNYSITVPIYAHAVMRPDVLARTHLQRNYLSQDDNFVAEVILAGEVCEVPEILKLVRYHRGSSGWVDTWDGKHIQNWYRPDEKSAFMRVFRLGWRHRLEYFRIVLAAEATPVEKLSMTYENVRAVGQRLAHKLRLLQHGTKIERTLPWQRY